MSKSFLSWLKKSVFPVMASLCLSACTFLQWQAVNFPPKFFDGTIKSNIVFDEEHNLSLLIASPDKSIDKNTSHPVIVFYYGGRWSEGQKDQYKFVATTLAKQGYVVVIPDYRKYPDVKYPAFQKDAAKALAWTYNNIEDYGGDKETLFVSGHSSGAHIGAMLLANEKFLDEEGIRPSIVKAFVGLAGPYAFTPKAEDLKDIFSKVEDNDYAGMKVSTYLNAQTPPMYLLHGGQDEIVYKLNVENMMEAANKTNATVSYKYYDEMSHVDMVSSLSWYFKTKRPILNDMVQFFETHKRH